MTQHSESPGPSQDTHADCLENIALGLHVSPNGQHPAPAAPEAASEAPGAVAGEISDYPAWLRFMAANIDHWYDSPLAAESLIEWTWEQRIPDALMQAVAEDMAAQVWWTGRRWTNGRQSYVNLYLAVRGWVRTAQRYASNGHAQNGQRYPGNGGGTRRY